MQGIQGRADGEVPSLSVIRIGTRCSQMLGDGLAQKQKLGPRWGFEGVGVYSSFVCRVMRAFKGVDSGFEAAPGSGQALTSNL